MRPQYIIAVEYQLVIGYNTLVGAMFALLATLRIRSWLSSQGKTYLFLKYLENIQNETKTANLLSTMTVIELFKANLIATVTIKLKQNCNYSSINTSSRTQYFRVITLHKAKD